MNISNPLERFKTRVHGFINRKIPVILTYHSVVKCKLPFDLWTHIPLARFEEHMVLLSRMCNVIPLSELIDAIHRKRIPEHAVAITFDDGFGNNYFRAFPVLSQLKLPATIFISTGFIGQKQLFWPERLAYQLARTTKSTISFAGMTLGLGSAVERRRANAVLRDHLKKEHPVRLDLNLAEIERDLGVPYEDDDPLFREWLPLDWSQVGEMSNSRLIEFGGHTADHHILSRLSDAEAYDQIQRCRTALDKIIQPSVKSWAYPNGTLSCFNNAHRQVLTDQGFRTTFTALPEYISVESDPGQLGRWGVGSGMTVSELTDIVIKRDRWKSLELNNRLKTIAYGGFR